MEAYDTSTVNELMIGALAALSFVAALYFLRWYRSSHDRFFLFFAGSFAIECVNRLHMGLTHTWTESTPAHYLVRLAAFALILLAIWDKNRSDR